MNDRRTQLVGSGKSKFGQAMSNLIDQALSKKQTPIEYATVTSLTTIRLDKDGYDIHIGEDFFVLQNVVMSPGDRVLVSPINTQRGKIIVLGPWQPSKEMAQFVSLGRIPFTDVSGISTVNDPSGTASVAAQEQFSRGWVYPGTRLRVIGECERTVGVGDCLIEVFDDALGVRTLVASKQFTPDGIFDFSLNWDEITENNLNFIEVKLTYDDAITGNADLKKCVLLAGIP